MVIDLINEKGVDGGRGVRKVPDQDLNHSFNFPFLYRKKKAMDWLIL